MHEGSDGTALRGMYADFLTEAASILNSPALNDAAAEYRALGAKWRAFAEMALDPSVAPLTSARAVLDQREAAIKIRRGRSSRHDRGSRQGTRSHAPKRGRRLSA